MKEMIFSSSRNTKLVANLKQALLDPLASDGGLFCPQDLEPFKNINELKNLSFNELAIKILHQLNLSAYEKEFAQSLSAYDEFDNAQALEFKDILGRQVLELWHGKTRAFKDLALAPLARFMSALSEQKLLICCATSGDTGPATLSAFNGLAKLVCIYPEGKTSAAQRAQMIKRSYENALVLGIDGNFDDAQSALKDLLNDTDFRTQIKSKNLILGAANSLNFGRILYQIIYHFYAALHVKSAKSVLVPSGNFGNALAAFYAKLLGAPIGKIKIITNENCVLKDFFDTGRYDLTKREFKCTASPAMDILKSSNLERLIAYFFGASFCAEAYKSLESLGYFELSSKQLAELKEHFDATSCSDDECLKTIASVYEASSELIDPHTACAFAKSQEGDVIASTAQWSKFAPTIAKALNLELSEEQTIARFSPNNELLALIASSQEHAEFCSADQIKERILKCLS